MMESSSLVDKAIERILEMSADLQIKRRASEQFSLAYHDYGVQIVAYGKVLDVLTRLQRQEECSPSLELLGSLQRPCVSRPVL